MENGHKSGQPKPEELELRVTELHLTPKAKEQLLATIHSTPEYLVKPLLESYDALKIKDDHDESEEGAYLPK